MAELEEIAKLGHKALKTSRRDIAYVVAIGGNGATTVSATMFFLLPRLEFLSLLLEVLEEFIDMERFQWIFPLI